MGDLLWRLYGSFNGAVVLLLLLFLVLFGLLSFGAMTALAGFFLGGSGGAKVNPVEGLTLEDLRKPFGLTAIVYPVFNENAAEIFERLRSVYLSVEKTGRLADFEFFVLSDSTNADNWPQEEFAWTRLCRELNAFGRLFYRRRRENTDKKAGNIADFVQNWGERFAYMVVMDADSVMAGEDIVKMTALMEKHPGVGLLQTAPRLVNAASFYGRVQQFAYRLYGDMFTAGLNFWQGPDGNYWGHNAIIRLQPFADFCGLPDLPGREPFGGKILSHDFVEAALMRRAGWEIWLLWDLEGSYEEGPQSLVDSAKRDRRWLQGNLQHTWLLFAGGLRLVSRFHLLLGILGYLASPMWFLFLLLSTLIVFNQAFTGLTLVPAESAIGPFLPVVWTAGEQGLVVLGATFSMLFLPKVLAFFHCLTDWKRGRAFGGPSAVFGGLLIETLYSAMTAPVIMLFHTKFLLWMLIGRKVEWSAQQRGATGTSWREAAKAHGGQSLLGLAWLGAALVVDPMLGSWLIPVLGPVVVSIPLSVWSSRPGPGGVLRRMNLLLTPEEVRAPPELREIAHRKASGTAVLSERFDPDAFREGVTRAIIDPYVNAVHVSLHTAGAEAAPGSSPEGLEERRQLAERLASEGPETIDEVDLWRLMTDGELMMELHRRLWVTPFSDLPPPWQRAMGRYRRPG